MVIKFRGFPIVHEVWVGVREMTPEKKTKKGAENPTIFDPSTRSRCVFGSRSQQLPGDHWGGSLRSPRKAPYEILQIWSPWSQECLGDPRWSKGMFRYGWIGCCWLKMGETSDKNTKIRIKVVWYLLFEMIYSYDYSGGYKWSTVSMWTVNLYLPVLIGRYSKEHSFWIFLWPLNYIQFVWSHSFILSVILDSTNQTLIFMPLHAHDLHIKCKISQL